MKEQMFGRERRIELDVRTDLERSLGKCNSETAIAEVVRALGKAGRDNRTHGVVDALLMSHVEFGGDAPKLVKDDLRVFG